MALKKIAPPSSGTFPVSGPTFVVLLLGTILLVGALNFLPGLTLGPIVEHFLTGAGQTLLTCTHHASRITHHVSRFTHHDTQGTFSL